MRKKNANSLSRIRRVERVTPLSRAAAHTAPIACAGLMIGVAIKLLDIHTIYLGDVFSQMSVWFFLCTLIAVRSSTPVRAAINVFSFCTGMLVTYYWTAEATGSVYSMLFLRGWAVFDCGSPLMGFAAWYAKGEGWMARAISVGILAALLLAAFIMFDRIRIADAAFAALTAGILFGRKAAGGEPPTAVRRGDWKR